ncbi:hypothetical protein ACFW04_013865 [Cataglyphis niger]
MANIDEDKHINLSPQRVAILRGIATVLMEFIDFTSSSASEEDEDELEHVMRAEERRKKISKGTFEYVLAIIAPRLKRAHIGLPMISPEKQFLIAIRRMTTPDSYSGFPKIIGTIDGTHINILAPRVEPASYVNRKGHHSIQLQAMCNHKAHFIHCFVGHPGSVHDKRVFRFSELQDWLGNPEKFPDDCHILGDAAYKLHQNVIVPYRDNGHLTPRQINFNFCHSSARIVIERAFGLLKTRFRSIRTVLAIHLI